MIVSPRCQTSITAVKVSLPSSKPTRIAALAVAAERGAATVVEPFGPPPEGGKVDGGYVPADEVPEAWRGILDRAGVVADAWYVTPFNDQPDSSGRFRDCLADRRRAVSAIGRRVGAATH